MTLLFRSKSYGPSRAMAFNPSCSPIFSESEQEEEDEDPAGVGFHGFENNKTSTSFDSPGGGGGRYQQTQFPIVEVVLAALRRSLVTCSVERDEVASSMEIGRPTEVRHVSHVTFDRFNGFRGLPLELQRFGRRVPSASVRVFGVSPQSMQCSIDERGNSVPTILLMMQKRLYAEGGLKAEGIFRITADNTQEEHVRSQLNNGLIPREIDVHCLAGLIKAWFRELPSGVLDSLKPEQVMHCNTQYQCAEVVKLLPPTEAALLNWAINLMADVVHNECFNKMNARNIAMVFAPNMTQMADPLTALIHAVQVMNLLRALIEKTLREREEMGPRGTLPLSLGPINTSAASGDDTTSHSGSEERRSNNLLREVILDRMEFSSKPKQRRSASFPLSVVGKDAAETKDDGCGNGESEGLLGRLSLKKGVKKLCRHSVFQLSKMNSKKSGELGVVNT